MVFGSKGIAPSGGYGGYEPLVVEICKFFKTGKPPVSAEETIAVFAFMGAARGRKRAGGGPGPPSPWGPRPPRRREKPPGRCPFFNPRASGERGRARARDFGRARER